MLARMTVSKIDQVIGGPGPGKASDGKEAPVLRIHAALHGETKMVVRVCG